MSNGMQTDGNQTEIETEIVRDGFTLDKAAMSAGSMEQCANGKADLETEKGDKMAIEYLSASSGYTETTKVGGRVVRFHRNEVEMLRNDGETMTVETGEFMDSALTVRTNGRKVGTIQGDYDGTAIILLRENYKRVPVEDDDEEDDPLTVEVWTQEDGDKQLRGRYDNWEDAYDHKEDLKDVEPMTNTHYHWVQEQEEDEGEDWRGDTLKSLGESCAKIVNMVEEQEENDEVTSDFEEGEKYNNGGDTIEITDVTRSGRLVYYDDGEYELSSHRENLADKMNNHGFMKVEEDDELVTDGGQEMTDEEETELDTPIKVRWTGYARSRISEYNTDFDSISSDRFEQAVNRQKTNVVIETVEEASAVASEMDNYSSYQRSWMDSSMDQAVNRVQSEIVEEMEERGYDVERDSTVGNISGFEKGEKMIADGGKETATVEIEGTHAELDEIYLALNARVVEYYEDDRNDAAGVEYLEEVKSQIFTEQREMEPERYETDQEQDDPDVMADGGWTAPIKIKWQGKARDLFEDRIITPLVEEEEEHETACVCDSVLSRQSTQLILRDEEEASAMYRMLEKGTGKHWYSGRSQIWDSRNRVRREVRREMRQKGWDWRDEDVRTDGGEDLRVNADQDFASGQIWSNGVSEVVIISVARSVVKFEGSVMSESEVRKDTLGQKLGEGGYELVYEDEKDDEILGKCISCQAFISVKDQGEEGYHCRNCGDEVYAPDMEANGYEYEERRDVWVRTPMTDGGCSCNDEESVTFETAIHVAKQAMNFEPQYEEYYVNEDLDIEFSYYGGTISESMSGAMAEHGYRVDYIDSSSIGFTRIEQSEEKVMTDGGMPPGEDDFRHGNPETDDETTKFESLDGSHGVEVTIPEDRKHIDGLIDAMIEADREAHRDGRHDDDSHEDCPLC